MKNQTIYWLIVPGTLLLGLGLGYLLFGPSGNLPETEPAPPAHGEEAATYTCSMHPQIRQNEQGICPICEMDLTLLSTTSSNDDPLVLQMTEDAVRLSNIETTIVGSRASAAKTMQIAGKIQYDERLSASQVAHVPGRIEQLYVTFTGEQVRKGQKLATIYSPQLITAQHELLEARKFWDIDSDLIQAARKKLEYWKIPAEQIKEIESSGKVQETFTIITDAAGIVTNRRVSVGDHIKEGDVLFDLVSLDRLWVVFDAYEEDLAHIKLGNRIEFTTPALPERTFSTRVNFIGPVLDPATRVAAVRGEVRNRGNVLKPEMYVRGTVISPQSGRKEITIPRTAVLWTGPRSVVYVKVPETTIPSYEYREVILGESMGDDYIVEDGLSMGEEVVTYGSFTIDAAAQLNNQQSMMNKVVEIKKEDPGEIPDYRASTPLAFKASIGEITGSYLALKDALVATDAAKAQTAGEALQTTLVAANNQLLSGDALSYWLGLRQILESQSRKILTSTDVEIQRVEFETLSMALIDAVKTFGVEGKDLYVQHCPMAFDDKGADWLSDEEKILNPYFGDVMLRCGYVKEAP